MTKKADELSVNAYFQVVFFQTNRFHMSQKVIAIVLKEFFFLRGREEIKCIASDVLEGNTYWQRTF